LERFQKIDKKKGNFTVDKKVMMSQSGSERVDENLDQIEIGNIFLHNLDDVSNKSIEKILSDKNEVIFWGSENNARKYFIFKNDLFRWFISLNIKLARQKIFRITNINFVNLFKSISPKEELDDCPREIITFGHRYGLIGYDYDSAFHFFPLIRLLTLTEKDLELSINTLREVNFKDLFTENLEKTIGDLFDFGLSLHKPDLVSVVKKREGLSTGRVIKLRQIAKLSDFSPEGIRRKELQFWGRLNQQPDKFLKPFLKALILLIMNRSGSLIQYINGDKELIFKFLCKCSGIKLVELPNIDLIIFDQISSKIQSVFSKKNYFKLDFGDVVTDLREVFDNEISFEDLIDISKRILNYRRLKVQATQRVCLTLKKINRPAHYSEIAEIHNNIFPENSTSEHNIHSYLLREELGVVYVGVRGTFALKEWGYKRPEMKLYDQVESIVNSVFEKTKRPVSFNTICAELGKCRSLVNLNSIKMSIYLNPKLERIENTKFIPKDEKKFAESIINLEKTEKVFSQFVNNTIAYEQVQSKESFYYAIWKCENCKSMKSDIFEKSKFVYLKCTSCNYERKYPSGIWGIHTNIPCSKCKNDCVIGFHPKYGPYLKCKKCGFWDKINKYLSKS
jgi:hypothetical protein